MRNLLTATAIAIVAGLTFATSIRASEAREYRSSAHALHQLWHHPDRNIYGYARENTPADEWRTAPTRNWYGPGEYDRLMNGSDDSTPGHN